MFWEIQIVIFTVITGTTDTYFAVRFRLHLVVGHERWNCFVLYVIMDTALLLLFHFYFSFENKLIYPTIKYHFMFGIWIRPTKKQPVLFGGKFTKKVKVITSWVPINEAHIRWKDICIFRIFMNTRKCIGIIKLMLLDSVCRLLNPWIGVLHGKVLVSPLVRKSVHFMESENSFPFSQSLITCFLRARWIKST